MCNVALLNNIFPESKSLISSSVMVCLIRFILYRLTTETETSWIKSGYFITKILETRWLNFILKTAHNTTCEYYWRNVLWLCVLLIKEQMKVKYIDQRNFTYLCVAMFCIDKTYSLIFSLLSTYVSFQCYCCQKLWKIRNIWSIANCAKFLCLYLSGYVMSYSSGCDTK